LTLPLAARAKSATGVEASGSAVADARRAAEQNRITNATFVAGFTNRWLADVEQGRGPRPDLVALDPPRTGLDDGVAAALGRLAPRRIAYVSCDPLALARDLSALAGHGFRVCSVTPFDMFPQTAHIEAVAVLEHGT
jgi:23S rRNA (uracil1939-C5)-methyltransferase